MRGYSWIRRVLFILKGSEFAQDDGQLGFDGLDGKVEEAGDVFVFEAVLFTDENSL